MQQQDGKFTESGADFEYWVRVASMRAAAHLLGGSDMDFRGSQTRLSSRCEASIRECIYCKARSARAWGEMLFTDRRRGRRDTNLIHPRQIDSYHSPGTPPGARNAGRGGAGCVGLSWIPPRFIRATAWLAWLARRQWASWVVPSSRCSACAALTSSSPDGSPYESAPRRGNPASGGCRGPC